MRRIFAAGLLAAVRTAIAEWSERAAIGGDAERGVLAAQPA